MTTRHFTYRIQLQNPLPQPIKALTNTLQALPPHHILPLSTLTLDNKTLKATFDIQQSDIQTFPTPELHDLIETSMQISQIIHTLHQHQIYPLYISKDMFLFNKKSQTLNFFDLLNTSLFQPLAISEQHLLSKKKLHYLAPEQCNKTETSPDHRSNLYSLGIMLYNLSTHTYPFSSEDPSQLLHQHIAQTPTPPKELNPTLSLMLSNIILKLLTKNPEARYQRIESLIYDLQKTKTETHFTLGEKNNKQKNLNALTAHPDLHILLERKTANDPVHKKILIKKLYAQHILYLDTNTFAWTWNTQKINAIKPSKSVAHLLSEKIKTLPQENQTILQLASCYPDSFSIEALSKATASTLEEIAILLHPAQTLGILEPNTFSHKKIAQALYNNIPEAKKENFHLSIAQSIYDEKKYIDTPELLIEMIHHLNKTNPNLHHPLIKKLPEFQYQASILLKNTSAYTETLSHLENALAQTDKTHPLHPNLLLEKAICLGQLGRYEQSEIAFETTLENTPQNHSTIYTHYLHMLQRSYQTKKTIQIAKKALKNFGITIPEKKYATIMSIAILLLKIKWAMRHIAIEEIPNLPHLQDKEKINLSQILEIAAGAYFMDKQEKQFALVLFEMTQLSLKYGNSQHSNMAWIALAITETKLHHYKKANTLGKTALQISRTFKTSTTSGRTEFLFYTLITPWLKPLETSTLQLRKSQKLCLKNGDYWFGGACIFFIIFFRFFSGQPLKKLLEEFETFDKFFQKNNIQSYNSYKIYHDIIKQLTDTNKPLTRVTLDTHTYEHEFKNDITPYIFVMTFSMIAHYTANQHAEAIKIGQKITPQMHHMKGIIIETVFWLYYPLALHAQNNLPKKILRKALKKFELWKTHCPENYLASYLILKAIEAEKKQDLQKTLLYYNEALQKTKEHPHHTALIYENLFRLYQKQEISDMASYYLNQAYIHYQTWGAHAKLLALRETYPNIIQTQTSLPNAQPTEPQPFDTQALINSSQIISSEIILDKLLDKLMKITIENAGAQRGILLLNQNDTLLVKIEKSIGQTQAKHFENETLNTFSTIPKTLIEDVQLYKKTILIPNASTHEIYQNDPYIIKTKAASILCMPIQKGSTLIGILYLENNLAPNIFTENNLHVLSVLASQAAISIENALLYITKKNQEAAEAANAIKSQFLAKMSHELRTPLHVILGSSQLLSQKLTGTQDPDIPNTLKILTQCSQNLLGLVNNILDLSKVEAGKIEISPKPLSLTHFLSRFPNWIAPMLTDKPIKFTLQTDLKEIDWIQTDPDILHQILTNLLRNAVKFTPSGTISLSVYIQGNTLYFAIQDSGIGISKSDIPKLFSPFTQLSSTHAQEGTGLGLSICKDYAEKLGGVISVTSTPNTGSTFTLTIPIQHAQNTTSMSDPSPPPQSETPNKNTRVLLCDDNAFNRTFAHMLLKNKVTLTLADSGQRTIDLLKENTFDILFLDIQMPDMDGVETLANIRSQFPHLNKMPIVALTAQAMTDDRDRLLQLGFDGYLAKPFTELEILELITRTKK